MAQFWPKQPASRWIRDNNITLTGNAASIPSTHLINPAINGVDSLH